MKTKLALALAAAAAATLIGAGPVEADRPRLVQFPPCPNDEYDYATAERCVWDARHMGNGKGKSFVITRNVEFYYIRHERAHCMLTLHPIGTCHVSRVPDDGGLFD